MSATERTVKAFHSTSGHRLLEGVPYGYQLLLVSGIHKLRFWLLFIPYGKQSTKTSDHFGCFSDLKSLYVPDAGFEALLLLNTYWVQATDNSKTWLLHNTSG